MARILMIDDTRNIRKMVNLVLKQAGHEVVEAEDGGHGLKLFGDGSGWDLTLVDQRMPVLEGREVVVEAKKRDAQARLIMITAFATREMATEMLRVGALDFLRKPFSTVTLRSAVEAALAHPRTEAAIGRTLDKFSHGSVILPAPGQADFLLPRLSFRLNGFSFWPIEGSTFEATPHEMEWGRLFQIRSPEGALTHCFIAITPHIREEMELEFGMYLTSNDTFWDKLCGEVLLNYIWEKASPPPEILPVYEVPVDLRHQRGKMRV